MRVVLELPAPSMEDGHATDFSPEMFGVAANVHEGLGHATK